MKKYNIEGNIDFFSELYKSLDEDDNKNKVESDNNTLQYESVGTLKLNPDS